MENSLMSLGQQAVIEPNQNHAIHVGAHLQILTQLDQQLAQMQVTMEEIIPKMQMIWEHAGQHMQMIAPSNPLFPVYKEQLQQLGEVIINGTKHLEAEQRKAAKAAGQEAESPMLSTDRQAVDAAARIAMLDERKKSMELDFARQKHEQQLAQKDADFAQKTAMNTLNMRLKANEAAQKAQKQTAA